MEKHRQCFSFLFFSSALGSFYLYYVGKKVWKIREPSFVSLIKDCVSFLRDREDIVRPILMSTAIGLTIIAFLYLSFLFYLSRKDRKKLKNIKPKLKELKGLTDSELYELYRKYYFASVNIFCKVTDEELYAQAMKIAEIIKKRMQK